MPAPITKVTSTWDSLGNLLFKTAAGATIATMDGSSGSMTVTTGSATQYQRIRTTTANVNAGATLLAAVAGYKYRLVDVSMIAIGGNAATATAVEIYGTQSTSTVALVSAAVAALTRSTVAKPNTSNVTVLADGASFVACDANTAITIGKTGGSLATATHIDVIITYSLDAA